MTGNIIDIFVGDKRERYRVNETRLSKCCSFFAEKLRDAGQQDIEKSLHLPDDDPEAFDMFASWLYEGKVKPVSARMKYKEGSSGFVKDHYGTVNPYFELYFMANDRGLVTLKNHVMDLLQAYMAEHRFVFSP